MNAIWIALGVISIILLLVYFRTRNAVWGGLTIGIIIGVFWKIFSDAEWIILAKAAITGAILGFGAELLGLMGVHFRKKRSSSKDAISQLADQNNEVVQAMNWLRDKKDLQEEFNEIFIKYGELGPEKAQEWLLEKYRNRKSNRKHHT